MKQLLKFATPALGLLAIQTPTFAEPVRVLVTIENLAPANGTSQTPHWVGFHDGARFDIYNGGTPANSLPVPNDPNNSVERLAEDGNAEPLSATFADVIAEGVDGVIPGPNGAIGPGDFAHAAFILDSDDPNNRYFSYASMVLPSNDFWYANGNPLAHPVFDDTGNFVAKSFFVTRDAILDAGTEVNSEIPAETAFFGQQAPNTGTDEGGVIRDFDPNDPETYFMRPGSGGILDDARFAMADFLSDGYPLVKISFGIAPVIADNARYTSRLSGRNEVPAVDSDHVGLARYRYDGEAGTLKFNHLLSLKPKRIQAMHLHLGKSGENGPVVASLLDAGATYAGRRGDRRQGRRNYRFARVNGELSPGDLVGPLAGKPLDALIKEIEQGNIYVNVHTKRFPAGELRGQLGSKKY